VTDHDAGAEIGAGEGGSIGGIILAAGEGRRMGRPKPFITVDGAWLVRRAINAAADGGLDPIVVVLGAGAEDRVGAFDAMGVPGLRAVVNAESASGQASSLRAGIQALSANIDAAVILLADQPDVRDEAVRSLMTAFREGAGPIAQASYGGRPAHPTLLARSIWPAVTSLTGDEGARQLIRAHPEWRHLIEVGGEPPMDIDTQDDLARWLSSRRPGTEV
jgi:CTP:molybdopterin cytidylyltransferase MocA